MKIELTKTYIESLTGAPKEYVIWDTKQSGFGVKVTPKGRLVYFLKYRAPSRRQRKYTVGVHGELTLQQARKIAGDIAARVRLGDDPMATKHQYRTGITVSQLCDRFIKEHAEVHKKASSTYDDKKYIQNHIKPKLGNLLVMEVVKQDVQKLHYDLRHTPVLANHVRAVLSKMFSLAEKWGARDEGTNPVRYVEKYPEKSRERYLSGVEEKRLLETLDALETSAENPHALALIRLLLFTGARVSEILGAKWEWVDYRRNAIDLPDSKTGRRTIYLNAPALQVLAAVPRIKNNPYILPSPLFKGKHLKYPTRVWDLIRKKAELADFRIHDLRHTFASRAIAVGLTLPEIGNLLGHTEMQTTQRYAHLADTQAQQAANRVGIIFAQLPEKDFAHA